MYHFRDKARYWSKIVDFFIPLLHNNPTRKTFANIFALIFSQPSQIAGLGGVNIFCKKSSVYSQLKRVIQTDRQIDRQTDRQTYGKAISIAERLLSQQSMYP